MAPAAWRGALPITYHVGPGPAKVHLKVNSNWDLKPLYDVIARIPGAVCPDEWVIRGNHHDAWVNGAEDPVSAASAAARRGPRLWRTAEAGVEAEAHHHLLRMGRRGAGPAGLDRVGRARTPRSCATTPWPTSTPTRNGRGFLMRRGSHIAGEVHQRRGARYQRPGKRHFGVEAARNCGAWPHRRKCGRRCAQRPDLRIGALGSGSDYTVFIDHLGIASLNLGFGGEDGGGIYHSIYDDFYWYTHFSDPDFVYGRALAQTAGTAVMRLAGRRPAAVRFRRLHRYGGGYVTELQKLAEAQRDEVPRSATAKSRKACTAPWRTPGNHPWRPPWNRCRRS